VIRLRSPASERSPLVHTEEELARRLKALQQIASPFLTSRALGEFFYSVCSWIFAKVLVRKAHYFNGIFP
jgi:hypothetical protein